MSGRGLRGVWVSQILSQRGPVGFGLPFINGFNIGLWVRVWKGFGLSIRPPESLSGLWV